MPRERDPRRAFVYKDRMLFRSQNPTTGEILENFESDSPSRQQQILLSLQSRYQTWKVSLDQRLGALEKAEALLRQNKEALARSISEEMGKLYRESLFEIEKSLTAFSFYRTHSKRLLEPLSIATEMKSSVVEFQPLGVILGVMPWNFPVWQVVRFALPALAAGNVVLLKPAPNVCRTTRILADCFEPLQGAFDWIRCPDAQVESLIADDRVQGVSFTGSVATGSLVASLAGKFLKKSVLELGGSDAALILDDAPLSASLDRCLQSRLSNAGQSCIAAKRFIVSRRRSDECLKLLREKVSQLRLGDPFDSSTSMGPMAREDLRARLHELVQLAQSQGMKLELGGQIPSGPGFFYPPTLLVDHGPLKKVWNEELFGPVVMLLIVDDESEMLSLANATSFGLGASIHSLDHPRAMEWARQLQAGAVFINGIVRSDTRLPFGGVKNSGYGRELGEWGLKEFTNIQTIVVDHS